MQQMDQDPRAVSRRSLLKLIGTTAGSAAMYHAMVDMGYAGTRTSRARSSCPATPRAHRC